MISQISINQAHQRSKFKLEIMLFKIRITPKFKYFNPSFNELFVNFRIKYYLIFKRSGFINKIKNDAKEAAKQRRKKENNEFRLLSNQLPVQNEIMDKLDKVSIIRLTVNYLKLKIVLNETKLLYPSKLSFYY